MRWTVIALTPDGTPNQASGMAGGICTARAHAAAAAAALYERLAARTPTYVLVTVTIGRRTTQFATPRAARHDLIDAVFALPTTSKFRPHAITTNRAVAVGLPAPLFENAPQEYSRQ